ncbi:MAG: hypothetical protein ACTHNN_10490 [Xanthobacteraceae bacterium]
MATSPLTDAIYQNTIGNSEGFPLGVPQGYDWYSGTNTIVGDKPPSDFTSVTGWGQVYPEAGAAATTNTSANVQVANFKTYVHLTNGGWVLVQDQSTNPIDGAHYTADFSGVANVAWNEATLADGSMTMDAPRSGYNDHFWPGARGTYGAGTIDGVFVEAQMKTNDPNANLVANIGADWWRSSTAPYVDGFANNPSPGMSDWVKLTTDYKTLYFSSMSPASLQADPPPGLTSVTEDPTAPVVTTPPVTTTPVTPPEVTTPPATSVATKPSVYVADNTLSVQPGGHVDLGLGVSTTDKNDIVSVNIRGLPSYESITSNLDGQTFSGKNITFTAAQVEGGLVLNSAYRGSGSPTATLSVSATGRDPVSGATATSGTQTITVTDPPASGGWSSPYGGHNHSQSFALLSQSLAGGYQGRADSGQIATTAPHASSWLNESLLASAYRS